MTGNVRIPISGVARICCEEGHSRKLSHGALTVTADFRAGCSSCSMTHRPSLVTVAALIKRAVSC